MNIKAANPTVGRLSSKSSNLLATTAVLDTPFTVMKHALAKQFETMKNDKLFRVDLSDHNEAPVSPEQRQAITGDTLWAAYLAAFPDGTNPVYRERTEHDCACCKHFIRNMGGVVTIVNGVVISIWDFYLGTGLGFYADVAEAMSTLVHSAPIEGVFLHYEKTIGTDKNFQQVTEGAKVWEHFHLHLPNSAVVEKKLLATRVGDARATKDVLYRGLNELTLDAFDTILDLIAQNSLYRGAEYKGVLEAFRKLKVEYDALSIPSGDVTPAQQQAVMTFVRDNFAWSQLGVVSDAVLRIRNTAIGTLLIDLSEGVEIEDAVKKFETSIMAPSNYKRPTALVSKAMIAKAQATVEELDLTSALERRYAVLEDVSANNVLFVDRAAKKALKGGNAFTALAEAIPEKAKTYDKVEEVAIERFLSDVLPRATSLEVLVENRHAGNFVSLVAPVDPGAKQLFKWSNPFSWSYAGNVTDSMKARVG